MTLTSQSDLAVEVYSLDFDSEYLRDEEVLSAVHVYDTDGYYRSVPRLAGLYTPSQPTHNPVIPSQPVTTLSQICITLFSPRMIPFIQTPLQTPRYQPTSGQPLPEEISKVYAKQLADAEKEKAVSEGGIDAEGSTTNPSSVYHLGGIAEEPKYPPPPLRTTPAARDDDNHQDLVVVGPPLSGVTALAAKLSKKTGLPVYTIDEVLLEVANTASETGEGVTPANNQLPTANNQQPNS